MSSPAVLRAQWSIDASPAAALQSNKSRDDLPPAQGTEEIPLADTQSDEQGNGFEGVGSALAEIQGRINGILTQWKDALGNEGGESAQAEADEGEEDEDDEDP